jgi:hypothetical protein
MNPLSSVSTYNYRPNLQPMSNLGSYNRYSGASSIGSRTKFGNASRMYSFAHATNQVENLENQFTFAIFGIKK